tara:strand:- start:1321 stop:1749 length:429 start_codon:yes stop_codon:yes gene_type:complete
MKKSILIGISLAILIVSIQLASGYKEETPSENFLNTVLSVKNLLSYSASPSSYEQPKPFYYALPQGNCKVVFSTQSTGFSPSRLSFSESDGLAERNPQQGSSGSIKLDDRFYTIKVSYKGNLNKPLQMSYICGTNHTNTISL